MDNRYEIAEQNGMSREFADWFFDNKKAGCGNVWFMMMAAMWEGWQRRAAMFQGVENAETPTTMQTAPALDSSPKIAESPTGINQGKSEPVTTAYKLPFEQWLSQQTGAIDVECGCVMTEVFFHWLRVAYEAGNSPVIPDGWVACSERMPEESGRYWCYVEEQNDLGKSHYQWNCAWNGKRWWVEHEDGGRVTHWMPLPAAPRQEDK